MLRVCMYALTLHPGSHISMIMQVNAYYECPLTRTCTRIHAIECTYEALAHDPRGMYLVHLLS